MPPNAKVKQNSCSRKMQQSASDFSFGSSKDAHPSMSGVTDKAQSESESEPAQATEPRESISDMVRLIMIRRVWLACFLGISGTKGS